MISTLAIRSLMRTVAPLAACLVVANAAQGATLTARGNEPGWQLEMTETAITFRTQDGETLSMEPVPAAIASDAGQTYSGVAGEKAFTLTIADRSCSDTMTGMPYPKTVTLVIGERQLAGCGGDPASLLHADWKIVAIGGKAIVEKSVPTITFAPDGDIYGNASCNRFFGRFALSGEGLTLSEAGMAMMLCGQPLMDQERALLAAFGDVNRFEVVSPTELRLLGNGELSIDLRK